MIFPYKCDINIAFQNSSFIENDTEILYNLSKMQWKYGIFYRKYHRNIMESRNKNKCNFKERYLILNL